MLLMDFPHWKTIYGYFRRLSRLVVWKKIHQVLVKTKRIQQSRNEHPSMLTISAQAIKTTGEGEQGGFDG